MQLLNRRTGFVGGKNVVRVEECSASLRKLLEPSRALPGSVNRRLDEPESVLEGNKPLQNPNLVPTVWTFPEVHHSLVGRSSV